MLGYDFAFPAKRHRFVRQEVAQRRPTSIVNGLRHSRLCQFGWADVSDVNFGVVVRNLRRGNMQEMFALVGDFRRQRAGADLLAALLKKGELGLALTIEGWRHDRRPGRENSERLQPEVYANGSAFALLRFRRFDLDIHIPASTRIGREFPGLRFSILRDRARLPDPIGSSEDGQPARIELCRPLEVRERDEIKIALEVPESRRLGKTGATGVRELSADSIDCIGMQAKFFGGAATKFLQIECRWSLDAAACLPSGMCVAINLAAVIPNEINGSRLSPQGIAGAVGCVFDAKSEGEYQEAGRLSVSADLRSRTRRSLARAAGSPFVPPDLGNSKAELTRPAIHPSTK